MYNIQETADRIRQLRQRQGLSQEQAACYLGVSNDSLSRVERGRQNCSVEQLASMGRLYGVSMDYLILGSSSEPGMSRERLEELIRYLMALREGLVRGMGEPVPEFPIPAVTGGNRG